MMEHNSMQSDRKEVGFFLGLGVFLLPIFFVWFTFRKGYSIKARFLSILWLILTFLIMFFTKDENPSLPISDKQEVVAATEDHKLLVNQFCYALQASSLCDDLIMRLDTEGKIESIVGGKLRGSGSVYNKSCREGIELAFDEKSKNLCLNTWEKYGCSGNVLPKLVQQSPFTKEDAKLCIF